MASDFEFDLLRFSITLYAGSYSESISFLYPNRNMWSGRGSEREEGDCEHLASFRRQISMNFLMSETS